MRIFIFLYLLVIPTLLFSQEKKTAPRKDLDMNTEYSSITDSVKKKKAKIATIDQYKIVTLEHDTIYADTSLTIKSAYRQNHLRKDLFGLLEFSNIGQPLNTLQYSLTSFSPYPEIGFTGKHFNYIQADQIRYYSAATPFTELFFNTTINKGQNVDSFITLNTSKNLNFSIAYRGLRSEGDYINQLVSAGNFRFTTSYATTSRRYAINAHFVNQDIMNEENGGITNVSNFESNDPDFKNRQRLQVYLTDAETLLKGRRVFFDHAFRVNPTDGNNNLYLTHQFNYEYKNYQYKQPTVASSITDNNNVTTTVNRFGDSYVASGINDETKYERLYNKVGAAYENSLLGKFNFFIDDYRSNYKYERVIVRDGNAVPADLYLQFNNVGAQYEYQKNKWNGRFLYSRSITNQSLSDLDAKLRYDLNEKIKFDFRYRNINKLPNNNYNLYQSSWISYNWSNDFKNEKINSLSAEITTPWLTGQVQYTVLKDHLYFADTSNVANVQIISPKQYGNVINYLEIKASREFKFGPFALDNTLLYQKVDQSDLILNVPDFVTRNTFYYSNHFFKKALFMQTGIVFNYLTKYYGDNYNPVIAEFFVQQEKKTGGFATFDVFINARIRQTRFYLKAEHLNALFSQSNYYSAPDNPYRDFVLRFGLVWNFFQ